LRWLQVELTVSGELAEPVSELLARCGQGGVVVAPANAASFDVDPDQVLVRTYLADDDSLPTQRRAIEHGLWHLSQIQPLPEPGYRYVENQDWSSAWKADYRPIHVGARLLIQPSWLEPEQTDRLVVRVDPGMAFGTGTHPTTRLCLEIMETRLHAGDTMVDLGAGSGILSIAGALLGASRVIAYDISEAAVTAARANVHANRVSSQVEVREGSLERMLLDEDAGLVPNLILANILAPVIEGMLGAGLADALPAGGCLIVSGILEDQSAEVERAAKRAGLTLVERRTRHDWCALVLKRNPSR
jgi:ribosomal protein L11 methyltransferase